LCYGKGSKKEISKGDTVDLNWAEVVKTTYFLNETASWLHVNNLSQYDLIVIGQENGNLNNYLFHALRWLGISRVAYFGHGKNFQATSGSSPAETFKRFWVRHVDWWFAYTEKSAKIVASAGFPRDRITVFENAVDTSLIVQSIAATAESEVHSLRHRLVSGSEHVGIYIGGLYDLKRIGFLIEAAQAVRRRVPDFHLLVIGGGPDRVLVEAAAQQHNWIHALGPRFGAEKTLLASLGRVFLMPGLVGLGVLDSFAYGTPMVTTDAPYHSPEIDYLKDGVNGVIVQEAEDVDAYADAVAQILTDEVWRTHLQAGAVEALQTYTIEAMAQRFADGVMKMLNRTGAA
jgi:glycosyltransferase involved in cell wall biosynthesis